jgi:Spx/MgsR family transcriptional regulator
MQQPYTSPLTLYGIANCDTVKKARAWLTAQGRDHVFHDFKKQGVPETELDHWLAAVGWEKLLNRKGTTWRRLDAQTQAGVQDAPTARALMLEQSSVIKRPVVQWGDQASGTVTVGFDAARWQSLIHGSGGDLP